MPDGGVGQQCALAHPPSPLTRGRWILFSQVFILTPIAVQIKQSKILLNFSTLQLFNVSTLFLGAPAALDSFSPINFLGGYPRGGVGANNRRGLEPYFSFAGWLHPRGNLPPPDLHLFESLYFTPPATPRRASSGSNAIDGSDQTRYALAVTPVWFTGVLLLTVAIFCQLPPLPVLYE